MALLREFYEQMELIVKAGEVRTNCNSITFINQGTADITINGVVLIVAGDQYYAPGNYDEINTGTYTVAIAPGSVGSIAVGVVRKFYRKV